VEEERARIEALAAAVTVDETVYVTATRGPTGALFEDKFGEVYISIQSEQTFGQEGVICSQPAYPPIPWNVYDSIRRCLIFCDKG